MHQVRSGCRSRLQNAEGQRHAAVVAQREVGGQAVVGHPAGRGPGEPVGRGTAFQPHGLDLPQGKGLPQTGACRFQERLLGGKIRCRAGQPVGTAVPGGQGCVQRQRCAFRRAVHPPHKGGGMGAGEAVFQMIEGADVAADAKDPAGLLSAAQF